MHNLIPQETDADSIESDSVRGYMLNLPSNLIDSLTGLLCMTHPRVMNHDSSSSNPPPGTSLIIPLCSSLDYRVAQL